MLTRRLSLALGLALAVGATATTAADRPYAEGTVWTMTLIKVAPGQFDAYMKDLLPVRKKLDDEAKKEGLLVSSRVLSGQSSSHDDFDLVILAEYKNWAAFDGITAKYDAMMEKLGESSEKAEQQVVKRAEVRTIIGEKTFQEIIPK